MSDCTLVVRATMIFDRKDLRKDIEHPELVKVSLPKAADHAFDIGSLAYSNRFIPQDRRHASKDILIDLHSLRPERIILVQNILDDIYISSGKESSLWNELGLVRLVMDWCDTHGYSDVFVTPALARATYLQYTNYLRHRLLVAEDLSPNTCAGLQRILKNLMKSSFGSKISTAITGGIAGFPSNMKDQQVPEEGVVRSRVRTLLDIAEKISCALIDNRPFPFSLEINAVKACFLPYSTTGISTKYNPVDVLAFDVEKCEIRTAEYLIAMFGLEPAVANRRIRNAQNILDKSNSNEHSFPRLSLASMVAQAYANIIIYITGATPSELTQFEFDEAEQMLDDTFVKQLKAIKFRAAGKVTRYTIGRKTGIKLLRNYLKFRKWAVANGSCNFFFIGFNLGFTQVIGVQPRFQQGLHRKIQGLFLPENAENIPPRLTRQLKSLVLHELDFSHEDIAINLNHTTGTHQNHYLTGSVIRQRTEFKNYWAAVHKAADLVVSNINPAAASIATGHCDGFSEPAPRYEQHPAVPSCRSQLGCLYCVHYSCHADEEDMFKLLSVIYVVEVIRAGTTFAEHAGRLFADLYHRASEIVSHVERRSDEHGKMVDKLRRKVFELGELTPFWESRLRRYEDIGII